MKNEVSGMVWVIVLLTFPMCVWVAAWITSTLAKVLNGDDELWHLVTMALFVALEFSIIYLLTKAL